MLGVFKLGRHSVTQTVSSLSTRSDTPGSEEGHPLRSCCLFPSSATPPSLNPE